MSDLETLEGVGDEGESVSLDDLEGVFLFFGMTSEKRREEGMMDLLQ